MDFWIIIDFGGMTIDLDSVQQNVDNLIASNCNRSFSLDCLCVAFLSIARLRNIQINYRDRIKRIEHCH